MARVRREPKRVTRYEHDAADPVTPETGHTALLPDEGQVVTVPMDNGWADALDVAKVDSDTIVVDMDPAVDPVLLWAGKRNRRAVPVLPLQRNEIVSDTRINQLIQRARRNVEHGTQRQASLFADLEKELRESGRQKRVEFYSHEEAWRNKLITGDSMQVMESLIQYEGLRGAVQTIYIDPPYGVKYNSNFQQRVDSTKNDERDRADDVLAIKAFNDTWTLGVHSYLSYLAANLYLCRELLASTGSIFIQINQENLHLLKALAAEVFGAQNEVGLIVFTKTTGFSGSLLSSVADYLIWFAKDKEQVKFRPLYRRKTAGDEGATKYRAVGSIAAVPAGIFDPELLAVSGDLTGQGESATKQEFEFGGKTWTPPAGLHWKTTVQGLKRLAEKNRILVEGNRLRYLRFLDDFPVFPRANVWTDVGGIQSRTEGKIYSVQTAPEVVERCLLMTSDPGDLVFDPTCGSGTTAYCAEKWGRRWITCDTSRVAINVARRRLLASLFEQFALRGDSVGDGFEYERVEHITLKSLAYDLEPETVDLVDKPRIDPHALRVAGPLEIMAVGRYSIEDWNGYLTSGDGDGSETLQNYVQVISLLYSPHAEIIESGGFLHAITTSADESVGISVGPLTGRVTPRQIFDACSEASDYGLREVHVLGWAFEANVGEEKADIEKNGEVDVRLVMIRPDALAEGLKVTQPEILFSPLALPELAVDPVGERTITVTVEGVGLFDRSTRTTAYRPAGDGYINAWYLDEDYDGDCFVDCQMFFEIRNAQSVETAAGVDVDADSLELTFTSEPFEPGEYRRIAVKVVDVYGNESTVVRDL